MINKKVVLTNVIFFILGVAIGTTITPIPKLISILTPRTAQLSDNIPQQPSQNNLSKIIPKDSYLREVKDIPSVKNIMLVAYIEKPIIEKEFDLNNIMTCPGSTLGQSIEGIYHLALLKNNALYSDIVIPSYTDEGNQEKTKQKLSFKNTKANAFYHFGGNKFNDQEKYEPVEVSLVQFGEFNTQKSLVDFTITGPTIACGHTSYLYGGYDTHKDELILYPIIESDKKYFWGVDFNPSRNGAVLTEWKCGDHGANTYEGNFYRFESTASAYILYGSDIEECK